jgi:asparagine synthase (glutamine-hydrolysing)
VCGICGVVATTTADPALDPHLLRQMNGALYHRGPDDEGYYQDDHVALAMRRLSIIDPAGGRQPISNEDGSLRLICNGEIYNYRTLRRQLEAKGHVFASYSDCEVVVHAYEEYGEGCLDHLNGMFALAVWDVRQRRLFLARDRLGIKPLYYWHEGGRLVFGSELTAVARHPAVRRDINYVALDHFLTLEYVPAPHTIYRRVRKLLPGHWLCFEDGRIKQEQYWEVSPGKADAGEAVLSHRLAELLEDAVGLQLVSDVPLGALLSGGIDSSTVVYFMSNLAGQRLRTFSIGFDDASYNELPYARRVADALGTEHCDQAFQCDLASMAERLIYHLDEPLADFSIFPTYLVSQFARESVKVVLSGDGGDELFGGYDTYRAQHLARYYRWLPAALRLSTLPALAGRLRPGPAKKGLVNKVKRFVEGAALPDHLQHTRWMAFLGPDEKARLYRPALREALAGSDTASLFVPYFQAVAGADPLTQQQFVDVKTYLPDNILTKLDRMSMAVSLEARVPLLDHRIVEFAFALPTHQKLGWNKRKVLLQRVMSARLPPEVLNKPKQGFSVPLKHWLCAELRPLMHDLLSPSTLRRRGDFEPAVVASWIDEHLAGRANHSHRLWALMVFELWLRSVHDDRTR